MKRQTGIILTVASAVLCGCPGLFFCLGGALSAAASPSSAAPARSTGLRTAPAE